MRNTDQRDGTLKLNLCNKLFKHTVLTLYLLVYASILLGMQTHVLRITR